RESTMAWASGSRTMSGIVSFDTLVVVMGISFSSHPWVQWMALAGGGGVEPVRDVDRAELGPVEGDGRVLAWDRSEVGRLRVGNHLARVVSGDQAAPDHLVEAEPIGTGNLEAAVQRGVHGDLGDRVRDVGGGDGLERNRRHVNLVAHRGGVG